MGNTHLNKLLAALNMSTLHWKTFKSHEKEVGISVEAMSIESCKRATLEEKRLTIENLHAVNKLLPPHLQDGFIFPNVTNNYDENDVEFLMKTIVRIFVLFYFGWTTKGSGRSYDSLSGTGAFIGFFSGKIVAFINLNRKCKSCDMNIPLQDHTCKKNFQGSAKAMEPYAAEQLVSSNLVFNECKIEVGIVGADNDSSAIKAMRDACSHEIVKHSDKNHTSKGVVSELYRMKNSHKELNGKEIAYLKKCFNYCVAQCKGDSVSMATNLRNIPNHCYNIHDNCGSWCGYHKNPDTYKHSVIGDGFHDANLFEDLKCFFNTLANKTAELSAGVSTNANESLNASITSFAPKTRLYGMSASGSLRTACAINKKNDGQNYCVKLNENLSLSPGRNTLRHANKVDSFAKRRYEKQSTIDAKKRRLDNERLMSELKNKKEIEEGSTYENNIGLLQNFNLPVRAMHIDENAPSIIVLFDLETGGFNRSADILQIAAKHGEFELSVYIMPNKKISADASLVNRLKYINGNLQYNGKNVIAFNLEQALFAFYEFLCRFKRKCILTAHNYNFDYPKLMRAITKVSMKQHFKSIIAGFGDTLPIIRKVTGRKGKGQNKLESLANDFQINSIDAHNAVCDVQILDQILTKLNIRNVNIINSAIKWNDIEKKEVSKKSVKCSARIK